jgi:hypothetical protein
MRNAHTGLKAGDHALFVDGKFTVNSGHTDSRIYRRAMENFENNPASEILHVVVVAKYSANPNPVVETLAEARFNQ